MAAEKKSARRPRGPRRATAPVAPPPPGNLDTVGDKLKVFSLQSLLRAKRDFKVVEPARLGDVLTPWFETNVAKPGAKLEGITEIWTAAVPAAIVERSRILGLARGVLSIALDSAVVRAELDGLLREGLQGRLQTLSRGSIFRVKTSVDGRSDMDRSTTYPQRSGRGSGRA